MIDPKLIDDLTRRLTATLPSGLKAMQDDIRQNVRASLDSTLSRLDLVTREEFDVQTAVLARTREKLEALRLQVVKLEEKLEKEGEGTVPS